MFNESIILGALQNNGGTLRNSGGTMIVVKCCLRYWDCTTGVPGSIKVLPSVQGLNYWCTRIDLKCCLVYWDCTTGVPESFKVLSSVLGLNYCCTRIF